MTQIRPVVTPAAQCEARAPALSARLPWWLLGALYALAAAFLAMLHPHPWRIALAAVVFAVPCALWSRLALVALPAMMPCASLVAWTGAFFVDEFDVFWMAGLAGASVNLASGGVSLRLRGATQWLVCLTAVALAVVHGIAAYTGYMVGAASAPLPLSPMFYFAPENALRVAKGFAWAFAALPVLHGELRRAPDAASRALAQGFTGAAAIVALAALWERFSFTGLTDLTSDYRSTALFWEMHVGGAALDACIALTLPFAVWVWLSARSRVAYIASVLLLLTVIYAAFTTFSRGVWAAVLLQGVLFGFLYFSGMHAAGVRPDPRARRAPVLRVTALAMAAVTTILLAFPATGYRGSAAAALLLGVVLACAPHLATAPRGAWWGAVTTALIGSALLVGSFLWSGKVAYFAFGICCVVAAVSTRGLHGPGSTWRKASVFAAVLLALPAALLVGMHRTESVAGIVAMLPATGFALALVAWSAVRRTVLIELTPRSLAGSVLVLGGSVMAAAMFSSSYMGGRWLSSERDMAGRLAHWKIALEALDGPFKLLFGAGLGTFPQTYYWRAPEGRVRGGLYAGADDSNRHIVLAGSSFSVGYGEVLRLAQRVHAGLRESFDLSARVRLRGDRPVVLLAEVCEKNLLYHGRCTRKEFRVQPGPGWQPVRLLLTPAGGAVESLAQRLRPLTFSIGISSTGGGVDIDDLQLHGAQGALLVNGDFARVQDGWLFTSDHDHMPWHEKNLAVNVLHGSGLVGLCLVALLFVSAMTRAVTRVVRGEPRAAPIATALIGMAMIGAFDSVFDVPRVTTLCYLMMYWALLDRRQFAVS